MEDRSAFLPGLSPAAGKPVRAAFNGGQLTSDAGILLLAGIKRRLDIAGRLAQCLTDPRAPKSIQHTLAVIDRHPQLGPV